MNQQEKEILVDKLNKLKLNTKLRAFSGSISTVIQVADSFANERPKVSLLKRLDFLVFSNHTFKTFDEVRCANNITKNIFWDQ